MSVEVINNNKTQVELLLDEIKNMAEGKVSADKYNSTMAEFKQAIDNRANEIDRQVGDLETKFEQKLADMVQKIGGAFEKAQYNTAPAKREMKYGVDLGDFMHKVRNRAPEIKDLSENTGASGGYLVPEEFNNEVLKVELENSVVRSNGARVIQMRRPILKVPALNMANNATSSMYGGVVAYWGTESGTMTESQPTFKRVKLEVAKLYGYCEDPNELEDDSIVSMGGLLTQLFGEVLAFEEDYAFLTGDGANKPLGVTAAPAYITVSRATASQLHTTDIHGMIARFKGNLNRSKFHINQSVLPYVYKLQDAVGNYIWAPSASEKSPGTLYGIPINVTEKLPALGTAADVLLADFGYYLIGDLKGLTMAMSDHFKFQNDQRAYRLTKRVDGQPWLDSAITPRAGGSTLSPFVGLY